MPRTPGRPMTPAAGVSALVARQQVGEVVRSLHHSLTRDAVGRGGFAVGLAALALIVVALVAVRSYQLGAELAAFGPGLVAIGGFVAGAGGTAALLIALQVWSRTVLAERERLSLLPLTGRQLWVHAVLPTALPSASSVLVGLVASTLICLGMSISPLSALVATLFGAALSLGTAAGWGALSWPWRRRPWVARARVVLMTLTVLALFGHGVAVLTGDEFDPQAHRWNPVVLVLMRDDVFAVADLALSLVLVVATAGLLWLVTRGAGGSAGRASTGARRAGRVARATRPDGLVAPWLPARVRVPAGLLRIALRQSSLGTEVLVMSGLALGAGVLGAQLWRSDRIDHAQVLLLIAAAVAAIPVLGARSSVGPTYRLLQLGVRPADARAGVLLTAVTAQGACVLVASAALAAQGVGLDGQARLWSLSTVTFAVALTTACLLRELTDTSVGRSLATIAHTVAVFVALQAGLTTASARTQALLAVGVVGVALVALRLTMRERTLT